MQLVLLALAAFASVPNSVQVDVGRADWSAFPELRRTARDLPMATMVAHVETILREGRCVLAGQSANRFDITVPYLVLLEPNGSTSRVVVADIGCPALETYVGSVVIALAREGDFPPTGERRARWYGSNFNFNLSTAY